MTGLAEQLPTVAPSSNGRVGAVLPTRQRRPGHMALLVGLVVALAAVAGYLYSHAGAKAQVVVVVRDVPAGHAISRSDLSTTAVAGHVNAISGSALDRVVGRTATIELQPNTLLQQSMLATTGGVGPGQALVGVSVPAGQLPADGVASGDTVEVITLPAKDAGPGTGGGSSGLSGTVLIAAAPVFSAHGAVSSGASTLVSLVVSSHDAPALAAASAAGRVALVKVAGQ